MKLPRDISGVELAKVLSVFGYRTTRQTGSHIRLTTTEMGEHHITIPSHPALRLGTLGSIVHDVAEHFNIGKDEVVEKLFQKR